MIELNICLRTNQEKNLNHLHPSKNVEIVSTSSSLIISRFPLAGFPSGSPSPSLFSSPSPPLFWKHPGPVEICLYPRSSPEKLPSGAMPANWRAHRSSMIVPTRNTKPNQPRYLPKRDSHATPSLGSPANRSKRKSRQLQKWLTKNPNRSTNQQRKVLCKTPSSFRNRQPRGTKAAGSASKDQNPKPHGTSRMMNELLYNEEKRSSSFVQEGSCTICWGPALFRCCRSDGGCSISFVVWRRRCAVELNNIWLNYEILDVDLILVVLLVSVIENSDDWNFYRW